MSIGRARHPGPTPLGLAVEVFSVGRWLTNGDLAVDVDVDFVAFVEHRLIPPGCGASTLSSGPGVFLRHGGMGACSSGVFACW